VLTAHQLLCVENRDGAFVEAVYDVIAKGGRRLAVLPFNERAQRIVETLGPAASNCELWALDSPENATLPASVRPLPPGEHIDAVLVLLDSGEALGAALLQLLDLDCQTLVVAQTDWYFKNRSLFLISIPKAGTHLLYELAKSFGYADGIIANSTAVRPGQWYCIEYSNSHTSARHFFIDSVREHPFGNRAHPFMRSPAIFIYRNPRDILVSEANYYHKDGNSPFAAYLARFSPKERLLRLIDDPWLLGNFRDRMAEFVPWLELPNVIPVSFEELVGNSGGGDGEMQRRLIWSLQLKLQIPGDPAVFAAQVFNRASPTFFAGKIGAWHESFSPDVEKCYSTLPQDFEAEFGYAQSTDGTTPIYSTRIDEFRRRKLSFSKADFSSVPIAQEYGFLGFNLVRFGGRVYAVAESLGAVDLVTMSADELAELPNANTLDEVKYLVALSMHKPVEALDSLRVARPRDSAVGNPETVQVVGTHRDFNLVHQGGRVYGVRKSLGEIDVTDGGEALQRRYGPVDFIVGETVGEIRMRVDVLEMFRGIQGDLSEKQQGLEHEMRREFQVLQREMLEKLQSLQAGLLKGQRTLGQIQNQMQTLERDIQEKDRALQTAVLEGQRALEGVQNELRALQSDLLQKDQALWAGLLEGQGTVEGVRSEANALQERMVERQLEFEARLASLNQEISSTGVRLAEELQQTKTVVHSHSRMWGRLARCWPIRVLFYLSREK